MIALFFTARSELKLNRLLQFLVENFKSCLSPALLSRPLLNSLLYQEQQTSAVDTVLSNLSHC